MSGRVLHFPRRSKGLADIQQATDLTRYARSCLEISPDPAAISNAAMALSEAINLLAAWGPQ